MKKWFGILGVLVVLAGCQDSTTDVPTRTVRPATVEPDTIVSEDGITASVFGPYNTLTPQRESAMWANADAVRGFDRLSELGYSLDPEGPYFVHATASDGTVADLTWFSATDPSGASGGIAYVQMGDAEFAGAFRAGQDASAGYELLEKGNSGPKEVLAMWGCLTYAFSLYQACMTDCLSHGTPSLVCKAMCLVHAVMSFIRCVQFEQL